MDVREERTAMMGIIWGSFVLLAAATMIFAGGNFIIILVLAAAATIATERVLDAISKQPSGQSIEKLKRSAGDHSDTQALLNLLDDEDIEELRHRVKARLMDRIEGSRDGELSTLDALLAEQSERRDHA